MPIITKGDKGIDFTFDTPWETGRNFFAETEGKQTIVFFLRYYGCTVCQLEIHTLFKDCAAFAAAGAAVYVVLQSEGETMREQMERDKTPFTVIVDPRQRLYAAYSIGSRDPEGERAPGHAAVVAKAKEMGFTHGKYEGNEYQLPAVFIFGPDHTVRYAYYGQDSSDIPDHAFLLEVLAQK